MKKAAFYTLLAAIFLCAGSQTTFAEPTHMLNIEATGGQVSAYYNASTKSIELKMFVEGRMERVTVELIDQNKNIVYNEVFAVNTNGVEVDIPTEIYGEGIFQLQVKGLSISFRGLYKFK
jgi:hypothetical protein